MASSKSIARAQDIVACGLCETDPKVKWKCLECRLLMCHKCCHKVHPKFKNAEDHQIIDIREVGHRNERSEVNLNNIKCTSHTKEVCCLYCESCQLLVCPSCIAKGHKGHSFVEMQAFYQQMYGKLKNKIQRLDLEENNMDKEIEKLQKFESKEKLKYQNLLEAIKKREKALVQMAYDYANTLEKEATDRMNSIKNSFSKEQNELKKSKQEMLEDKTKCKQILDTQNGNDYFKNRDEMLTYEPRQYKKSIKPEDNQMFTFFPGNFSMDVFGSFQIRNRKIDMAIKKTFTTEFRCCHGLAVCDNGKLWTRQQLPSNFILQKVSIKENALKILEIPTNISTKNVYDIKTFNNRLFIADKTPTLKILKTDDNVIHESKFTAPDRLYIVGFDFTHDGRVVMATRSTKDPFPLDGRCAVVRMSSNGKQDMVCEYDQQRKRIFSCPRNVCCTKIGNIFIIDQLLLDGTGRVICLIYDGNVINTFNGLPEKTKNSMIPSSIISTPSDNVIVSDFKNNILYLLDNNGEFLSSFDTAFIGIDLPYSMVFTNPTTLYIGCITENDSIEKAKLYEILFIETN